MNYLDSICLPENLVWAWKKVLRNYEMNGGLYRHAELLAFELNLERNLDYIAQQLRSGEYVLQPIKLSPQPKRPDENGPRMRQSFDVSIRDQVAWVAVVNAIGPTLDEKMPDWSYGHRLFRNVWNKEDEVSKKKSQRKGPYRHTQGYIYRKFNSGWPLFRRHISLTARIMVKGKFSDDEIEKMEGYEKNALSQKLMYLQNNFWREKSSSKLYYASIDLKKFYPNISKSSIMKGFEYLNGYQDDLVLQNLLSRMLDFTVDDTQIGENLKKSSKPEVAPGPFDRIPTGLLVAGFLSNVAMLHIDLEIDKTVIVNKNIAHFRYVDDHSIIAYDFQVLKNWILEYEKILVKNKIGDLPNPVNEEKCDPVDLKFILWPEKFGLQPHQKQSDVEHKVKSECEIDGNNPTKLMTRTLAQVSALNMINFDILSDPDKRHRLEQLEWLLLADIPDREIRGDTRVSFAAGKIARLAPYLLSPNEEILRDYRMHARSAYDLRKALSGEKDLEKIKNFENEILRIEADIQGLELSEVQLKEKLVAKYFSLLFRAFSDFPDKTRLFSRLLVYIKFTGHDGFRDLEEWVKKSQVNGYDPLSEYLGTYALQLVSRHCLESARNLVSDDRLHSEKDVAKKYLENVSNTNFSVFYISSENRYSQNIAIQFAISLLGTAALLQNQNKCSELIIKLRQKARTIIDIDFDSSSADWELRTGYSMGLWLQWIEEIISYSRYFPSRLWVEASKYLDPNKFYDWQALRRFPKLLNENSWRFLYLNLENVLVPSDAGWLLDAARAAPESFQALPMQSKLVENVNKALFRTNVGENFTSLYDWCEEIKKLDYDDPRGSEWTALEIIRQILFPIFLFWGKADSLDLLHPNNILLPKDWLDNPIRPSWEEWHKDVRRSGSIQIKQLAVEDAIIDYRMHSDRSGFDQLDNRLRTVGQILWFILRCNFSFPSNWNIRGLERADLSFISSDMERLPISSTTLSLLISCLQPRSHENRMVQSTSQSNLFGHSYDEDMDLDTVTISGLPELMSRIEQAQAELSDYQITVLHHAPRQLIPVHLERLGFNSSINEGDEEYEA